MAALFLVRQWTLRPYLQHWDLSCYWCLLYQLSLVSICEIWRTSAVLVEEVSSLQLQGNNPPQQMSWISGFLSLWLAESESYWHVWKETCKRVYIFSSCFCETLYYLVLPFMADPWWKVAIIHILELSWLPLRLLACNNSKTIEQSPMKFDTGML